MKARQTSRRKIASGKLLTATRSPSSTVPPPPCAPSWPGAWIGSLRTNSPASACSAPSVNPSIPQRGHLVANGNRLDPDFSAPRRHADKTRLSHSAAPRNNRESSQHERRASRPRRNRLPHNPETLALHAPHHLWRRRTLRPRILEQNPRRLFRRRRRPMRQRRLHLGPGPRGRRNQSRRPPPKFHGNRKRARKSSRRSRSRRSRPPRRNQRRSHRLLRSPARGP